MPSRDGKTPKWLDRILSCVDDAMRTPELGGPLGYAWQSAKGKRPLCVQVFPTPTEILYGPNDGKLVTPTFVLCVPKIRKLFDRPAHVDWLVPAEWTGELDGPCLLFQGRISGRRIELSIYDRAPAAFEARVAYNTLTSELGPKDAALEEEINEAVAKKTPVPRNKKAPPKKSPPKVKKPAPKKKRPPKSKEGE